ncbi:MAG: hypothetical protein WBL40_20480 [Terrimicrobiaceae bacterium]
MKDYGFKRRYPEEGLSTGVFIDGVRSVAVLIAEDADGAVKDNALEVAKASGLKNVRHADDVDARSVQQIVAFRLQERRHVVAQRDDSLNAVFDDGRHHFFQVGHIALLGDLGLGDIL